MTDIANAPWDLVMFSDDWGRRPSAPQHLGRHLADGRQVLWVEPAGLRRPRLAAADVRRALQKMRGFVPGGAAPTGPAWLPTPKTLTRMVPPVLPAYGSPAVRAANDRAMRAAVLRAMASRGITRPVVITTIPTMAGVLGGLGERASIYLRMDDFALWPGYDHRAIAEREAALIERVDAVVAPAPSLLLEGPAHALCIPHGVDHAHFAGARPQPLSAPGPRLLVAGRLDERVDWDLLSGVLAGSDLHLVLLGEPVAVPDDIRAHPRAHLLPAVPYSELPGWLAAADVLLVPYADTPLGHSLAPLKTRELLATGRPVIATPLRGTTSDLELTDLVSLAADVDSTLAAVRAALAEPAEAAAHRVAATATMGWDRRARALSDLVHRLLTS